MLKVQRHIVKRSPIETFSANLQTIGEAVLQFLLFLSFCSRFSPAQAIVHIDPAKYQY